MEVGAESGERGLLPESHIINLLLLFFLQSTFGLRFKMPIFVAKSILQNVTEFLLAQVWLAIVIGILLRRILIQNRQLIQKLIRIIPLKIILKHGPRAGHRSLDSGQAQILLFFAIIIHKHSISRLNLEITRGRCQHRPQLRPIDKLLQRLRRSMLRALPPIKLAKPTAFVIITVQKVPQF